MTDEPKGGHPSDVMQLASAMPASAAPAHMVQSAAVGRTLDLATVYRDHYEFVWRAVRRLGAPEAHVDDAVQDVFLVVHRRLADFEGRSQLKTWLFGIAMRVVKDHRRKTQRMDRRHQSAPRPEPDAGPDEHVQRRQAVELLDQLLEELDDDKRAVFVMAEIENMTAPEIAETLGVKLNTVYSRLRLARKRFERALSRHRTRTEQGGSHGRAQH